MAGYRPKDWHVLDLEKDPTPGDPERVRSLAKNLQDFADDVAEGLRLVKGMAGEDVLLQWAGKSADVFAEEFDDVPKNLKKLTKSYGMAGDALADYWPKLERAQSLSDKALAKGREAQSDLKSANSRLSDANSWVSRATKESDKYQKDKEKGDGGGKDVPKPDEDKVRQATRNANSANDEKDAAQGDVTAANNALDAAKKMAEDARKMREDAAREAKNKLEEASDAGIQNRSWWEEIGDWVSDNWDDIVAVCKVVVTVVGIVAMIIGGPILAAVVLIAAAVVLADTLYKYSKGEATLLDVGLAALDMIPGMKGLTTLGGLAKGLKGGLTAVKGGMKSMSAALRGLTQGSRVLQTGASLRRVRNGIDFETEWADEAYDAIRNADDVDNVAASAAEHGLTRADVEQIKSHLFREEHALDSYGDTRVARFDSNPRIAEAWQRLSDGTPHSEDITLLRHELHESNHMRASGSNSYSAAHQATLDAGLAWDDLAAARDGFGRRP